MEVLDIFLDSLKYPFSDIPGLFAVGILFTLSIFFVMVFQYNLDNILVSIIGLIFAVIISFILYGYCLTVIKNAIYRFNVIPHFSFFNNFINGIKMVVINIIYFFIPAALTIFFGVLTLESFTQGLNAVFEFGSLTFIISIVLFVIFGFFGIIAVARFALNDRFLDALNIKAVAYDAYKIGFIKIFSFLIAITCFIIVAMFATSLIKYIPVFGILISSFIFGAFILLFISRSIGLLYSQL